MTVPKYFLPQVILTREQTQFFADVTQLAIAVEYAPFGDIDAIEEFRLYTNGIDTVFGEGAVEASADLQVSMGETTREALLLIAAIRGMAKAINFGLFHLYQSDYMEYYDNYIRSYVNMYAIEED